MSRPSDVNALLYDSESVLSRDSLDVGSDGISSLRSSEIFTAAAFRSIHNNLNYGSPTQQLTQNAASKPQAARATVSGNQMSGESKKRAKISWWWWWEIGGALLSIICVGLILVVLFMANDYALAAWPLWIQPNSLIAIFTTIGKSAMMVPIASCISQLKWRHFELRANRLSDLQLLDEASRGPWGSLMLLADVRTRAFTARALAILCLMSLGFDPSAQQILEFPTREASLTNTSASIGVASAYDSKAFLEDKDGSTGRESNLFLGRYRKCLTFPIHEISCLTKIGWNFAIEWNQDLFKLQSSIIDGISGSVFQPPYSCPGERCSWPDFTTLGICSSYLNLTDTVEVKCVASSVYPQQNCSYRFPTDLPVNSYSAPYILNISFADQVTKGSPPTSIFASRGVLGSSPGDGGLQAAVLYIVKLVNDTQRETWNDPPQVEAHYSSWYWCERTYHNVTANPSKISNANYTSEMLSPVDHVGGMHGAGDLILAANSTGHTFTISSTLNNALAPYLYTLLTRDMVDEYPHAGTDWDDDSLDLSTFLYTADLKNVTENLASTLTNQVRSVSPGDNNNATLLTSGDVFVKEVYIRVTWPWLTIPLAETLITTVLLVSCMLLTRHRPLLKTSLIALLVHGLDGWSGDEIKIPDPEDSEKLEGMAETMTARFKESSDGRLKFFKRSDIHTHQNGGYTQAPRDNLL